jgi:hypothetical protein
LLAGESARLLPAEAGLVLVTKTARLLTAKAARLLPAEGTRPARVAARLLPAEAAWLAREAALAGRVGECGLSRVTEAARLGSPAERRCLSGAGKPGPLLCSRERIRLGRAREGTLLRCPRERTWLGPRE